MEIHVDWNIMLHLSAFLNSYLHNCEESVKQIDSLNKGLGAVAKETSQAPQFFHCGVSAFCRHSTVTLKKHNYMLVSS